MVFNDLLQDKRVRSEQSKYEAITRQRASVISKYKRVYQEFLDLEAGLEAAKKWYSEMKDTVNSLEKNVESFVNNRRSEGAQLLNQIEQDRASNAGGQTDRERERLRSLMERMSMDPTTPSSKSKSSPPRTQTFSQPQISTSAHYLGNNLPGQYQLASSHPPQSTQIASPSYNNPSTGSYLLQSQQRTESYQGQRPVSQLQEPYDPSSYLRRDHNQPISPPATQQHFQQSQYSYQQPIQQNLIQQHHVPPGYIPPPPPPGPPPLGPQHTIQLPATRYSTGSGSYPTTSSVNQQRVSQQHGGSTDPWAGLNAWK